MLKIKQLLSKKLVANADVKYYGKYCGKYCVKYGENSGINWLMASIKQG